MEKLLNKTYKNVLINLLYWWKNRFGYRYVGKILYQNNKPYYLAFNKQYFQILPKNQLIVDIPCWKIICNLSNKFYNNRLMTRLIVNDQLNYNKVKKDRHSEICSHRIKYRLVSLGIVIILRHLRHFDMVWYGITNYIFYILC